MCLRLHLRPRLRPRFYICLCFRPCRGLNISLSLSLSLSCSRSISLSRSLSLSSSRCLHEQFSLSLDFASSLTFAARSYHPPPPLSHLQSLPPLIWR